MGGIAICAGVPLLISGVVVVLARRAEGTSFINFVGVVLTWPWFLLVSFAGSGHCPQGDPETWTIGHLLNAFLFWLALPLLLGSLDQRRLRWTVPIAVLTPLVLRIPEMQRVVVGGGHLCGDGREIYYTDFWTAQYYPAMWAYALILTAAALFPYARRRLADAPASPA